MQITNELHITYPDGSRFDSVQEMEAKNINGVPVNVPKGKLIETLKDKNGSEIKGGRENHEKLKKNKKPISRDVIKRSK